MEVTERLRERSAVLTAADRRIAEVVLRAPDLVSFGTVADLAQQAGTGTATVVRFAGRLGYDGFGGLQEALRRDLVARLRPAAERLRESSGTDAWEHLTSIAISNVATTLERVDAGAVGAVVERLGHLDDPVALVSGDASAGVVSQFAAELSMLRDGVHLVVSNEVAVRGRLALLPDTTTLIAVDLPRYDRWLVEYVEAARRRGLWIGAVTDSVMSPLAVGAGAVFAVDAASVGPYDSQLGVLAVLETIVAEAAAALRASAQPRLDAIEAAWREGGSLTEG